MPRQLAAGYLTQAYFLINSKEKGPCFQERIEAWDLGPVVPEAYREYKQYGGGDIPSITTYFKFDEGNLWNCERIPYEDNIITEEDKQLMNEVVDQFSTYTATDLVSLTHQQAPWKKAYVPNMNHEITTEAIKEYFDEEEN